MKKAAYLLTVAVQAALLAGAYAVEYFTERRLGMQRWVAYMNRGWEAAYPLDALQIATTVAVVALAVVAVVLVARRWRQVGALLRGMAVATVVLALAYAAFWAAGSTATVSAYYFLCGLLALVAIVQTGKTLVALALSSRRAPGSASRDR